MSIVKINIEKAKEIRKNQIRLQRKELFSKLDTMWMIAFERGQMSKVQEISAMKEKLRDATKSLEILESETLEDLVSADPLKEIKEYLNG